MAKDLSEALAKAIVFVNKLRIKKKEKDKKTEKKTYTRKKVKPTSKNTKLKIKDTKTFKRKGGALTTNRTPQYKTDAKRTAAKKAQQTKNSARKKARWDKAKTKQQKSASGSYNVKKEWNPKTKKWETRYGEGTTKPRQSGPVKKAKTFVKETAPKVKKGAAKVLKKIRNVKGAKTVGKGLQFGGKWGGRALKAAGILEASAGGLRTTANVVQRIRKKPLIAGKEGFGGATTQFERDRIKAQNAYLKKHGSLKGFTKAHSRFNPDNKKTNKKTNTKKTTTTPTTSTKSQLDQNIDKAKGWNKRQLQKKKDYQSKFGKLSNIPAKEGNATIPGPKGKAVRINEDFGKKPNITIKSKKKSGSKYPAMIGGKKTSSIQKKLLDSGFTAAQLAKKMEDHKKWKAARGRR